MSMVAVVPVRAGVLATGGSECVAECGGRAVLVGDDAGGALGELTGIATAPVRAVAMASFAPAAWAGALAGVVADDDVVVLPASPDGRDLAPRLAAALGRPLLAGAVAVTEHGAELARMGGLVIESVECEERFVATLQPGIRGVEPNGTTPPPPLEPWRVPAPPDSRDAEVLAVLPPDVATMDLAEAGAIFAGGAGLDSPERFQQLERVASALGASVGATRVVTDRGWLGHERQIGTTGVVVSPRLYVAFGISGAVQHTSGLGHPDHIASVNVDAFCPMMQLADVSIVADANAVLDELAVALGLTADA